ncbi:MAG: Nif3-like dinuclear metal center hexameric protein, partial [Bacteroidota bacterium]
MKLKNLINFLEQIAPPHYQESYDNVGLIVGNREQEITGVLTCLDSTEAVLEEAISLDCNVVVAHHPIVFKGLKSITGRNYVERVILKAIKNDIAIYAIHTNLDNMYAQGVNTRIAERLGLQEMQILAPKAVDKKLTLFVDADQTNLVRSQFAELPM